jgi:acylphosphatase
MEELHVIFKGRVQGVGFRWTVLDHADSCGLKGTVENLPNGDVEVIAQGKKDALETFLHAVQNDPGLARIDSTKSSYHPIAQSYTSFRIRNQ